MLRGILARAGVEADIVHRLNVAAVRLPDDVEAADVLFLDHDLCMAGDDGVAPCPVTRNPYECRCPDGRELTDRIIALGIVRPVVIQSANVACGPEMLRRFVVAGWPVVYAPVMTWLGMEPKALVRRMRLPVEVAREVESRQEGRT
jgi:hypothetical protein